jgi:hypothetical protein
MNLVVVLVSNRPIDPDAYGCITRLRSPIVAQRDCADIALGRNLALSGVCDLARVNKFDCALLVDDDMVFTVDDVKLLTEHAMASGVATSACYVGASGEHLMAAPWEGRWITGLGLVAIPMPLLLEVHTKAPHFTNKMLPGRDIAAFCSSGIIDGVWYSEDFQLCMRLGGVDLLPEVCVGHIKKRILKPTTEQVQDFLDTLLKVEP